MGSACAGARIGRRGRSSSPCPNARRIPNATDAGEEPHPAARHLHPAEPVHDGRAVRGLLRDRAGDEPALRPGGDRDLRRRWCSTASTAASRASRKTQSAFGAEYDSLADMVSFGAAPALVIYEWALQATWASSAGSPRSSTSPARRCGSRASTRMLDVADKRWFQGLPSPSAAALVAGFVFVMDDYGVDPQTRALVGVGGHAVRRAHDGEQPQVLQLQDDQPAAERTVRRDLPDRRSFIALLSYQPAIVLFGGVRRLLRCPGYVGVRRGRCCAAAPARPDRRRPCAVAPRGGAGSALAAVR